MESNPYEPPRAPVADIERPVVKLRRPRYVSIALTILWIMFALKARATVPHLMNPGSLSDPYSWSYIAYLLGALIVPAWLYWKIAAARSWPRIAATLFLFTDLLFRVYLWINNGSSERIVADLLPPASIEAIALVLLYLPQSNAWFRARADRA